ncbi:MAG TPA: hypothetical protein VLE89_09005 [Chlamydiales bacterium]|nr:hypothetical protein [Chlamydiales bacterium]
MKWLFFLLPLSLFSAYIGNPANPAIMNTGFFSSSYPFFKFTTGYIADYISDKRYVAPQKDPDIDPNNAFRHFGLHSQLASVSMIIVERLELFGYVGGSKEHVQYRKKASLSDLEEIFSHFQSTYQFSWSTGGRAILLQWGQTYFTTDFTYFAVPSSPKAFFKFLNRLNLPMDLTKQKTSLREWQVSAALASRFLFFTPYFGGTYLHSRLHLSSGPDIPSITYRNEKKWGYFFGFTVSLTGRFHLNFERRMRDEFAYAFSTIAVF